MRIERMISPYQRDVLPLSPHRQCNLLFSISQAGLEPALPFEKALLWGLCLPNSITDIYYLLTFVFNRTRCRDKGEIRTHKQQICNLHRLPFRHLVIILKCDYRESNPSTLIHSQPPYHQVIVTTSLNIKIFIIFFSEKSVISHDAMPNKFACDPINN